VELEPKSVTSELAWVTKPEANIVPKMVHYSFRCTQLASHLFPELVLGVDMLKGLSLPYLAMTMIKFRANGIIFAKSFSSPLFTTLYPSKLNACDTACAYTVKKFMTELQQLDNVVIQWDNVPEDNQLEEKDSHLADGISDPDGFAKGPEVEPVAINDGSSGIDEYMSESYYSGSDQEDTALSSLNKNQIHRSITPQTVNFS
jgi:hypothetical protein